MKPWHIIYLLLFWISIILHFWILFCIYCTHLISPFDVVALLLTIQVLGIHFVYFILSPRYLYEFCLFSLFVVLFNALSCCYLFYLLDNYVLFWAMISAYLLAYYSRRHHNISFWIMTYKETKLIYIFNYKLCSECLKPPFY